MESDLSYLIQLQKFDSEIDELSQKADEFNAPINAKKKSISTLKENLTSLKDKSKSFLLKKKELELEADEKEKLVKKHQGELNSLKSNDAYKAMLGEIDAAKKAQVQIEDQLLELMDAIEKNDLDIKKKEIANKEEEARINGEIQKIESDKKEILSQAESKKKERDTFAQTVPEKLLKHYDSLRQKKGGLAIVPVLRKSCGGCNMGVEPHKLVEIKKAKNMVICESCLRILYTPQDEKQEAPVTPKA